MHLLRLQIPNRRPAVVVLPTKWARTRQANRPFETFHSLIIDSKDLLLSLIGAIDIDHNIVITWSSHGNN